MVAKPRVIVVGAGIVGASFAFHLNRRGAHTTLIESGEPAQGVTAHAFGWLNVSAQDAHESLTPLKADGVHEYRRLNEELNVWDQLGTDIDSEDEDDSFGFSVSLSANGRIVAAGAPWNDMSSSMSNTGHVRVFRYDLAALDWVQMGTDIDGLVKRDNFGYRVELSADGLTLAASSFLSDGVNAPAAGHVRVFDFDEVSGDWVQRGDPIDGVATGDEFGQALSLSANGQVVAGGAVYATNDDGIKVGHIRVFEPVKDEA